MWYCFSVIDTKSQISQQTLGGEASQNRKDALTIILLLKEFFENYYQPLRLQGSRSSETIRLYGLLNRRFSEFLGREAKLEDLTNLTIARFMSARLKNRSPHTVERERNQLVAMWRLALTHRLLSEVPDLRPLPVPKATPKGWTEGELKRLVFFASCMKGKVGPIRAGVFWPALIMLCFETAERIGAIMECRPEDLEGCNLTVCAEYRKGGKQSRVYTLSEKTAGLIHAIKGKEKLIDWREHHTYLWDRFRTITKRAGLYAPRLGFHTLRRSAASHYAQAGFNPSQLLGHVDPKVTERYLDPRITEKNVPKPYEVLPKIG